MTFLFQLRMKTVYKSQSITLWQNGQHSQEIHEKLLSIMISRNTKLSPDNANLLQLQYTQAVKENHNTNNNKLRREKKKMKIYSYATILSQKQALTCSYIQTGWDLWNIRNRHQGTQPKGISVIKQYAHVYRANDIKDCNVM